MQLLFMVMAVISVASALGVLLLRQPLYSAFCLILNMLTIAGYFAMLEAHFLAAAQIIVYAGAIMVLVVFVIMLLSLGGEEKRSPNILLLIFGTLGALGFLKIVMPLMNSFPTMQRGAPIVGDVRSLGQFLFSRQLFAFEFASILITAAIVGALMLARRDQAARKEGK